MKALLLKLLAGYAVYAAVMVVLHPTLLYPFEADETVLDGFERVRIGRDGDVDIYVQERPGPGPVVLYFMGNAGSLSLFAPAFEGHLAADRHIIALEYRGGAGRPGRPSEAVLKGDALRAAEYAARLGKPVIVQGYSLGTGLATHVAALGHGDRVILTAPYDRLCRVMSARGYVPACVLPFVQKWRALRDAREIKVPILILHGSEDTLIPPAYSVAYEALPTVTRLVVEGAGHGDVGLRPASRAAIEQLVGTLTPS